MIWLAWIAVLTVPMIWIGFLIYAVFEVEGWKGLAFMAAIVLLLLFFAWGIYYVVGPRAGVQKIERLVDSPADA